MDQFLRFAFLKTHDMRKTSPLLFSLILFLACFTIAHAQNGQIPAPISVTIDSYQSIQELPQPDWVIKEGDTPLTIQDILNGDIKDGQILEVHPNENIIEQFGKYWFAIEFISEEELSNWLLHVENTPTFGFANNFSELRSFAIQDGQLGNTGITGFFVPASKRDYNSRHTQSLLNLSLSPGSRLTLWMNISENLTLTTTFPKLSIYDPSISLPEYILERRDLLLQGSYLIIWILSLIMYFYLRDRTSLWFFVFLTTANTQFLTMWSSDPWTPLLYPENPGYGLYFGMLASILNLVCLLQFSRVFVNLPMKHPKLDKFMIAAIWVLFFSGFLNPLTVHFERTEFSSVFYLIYGGIFLLSGISYLSLKEPLSLFMGLALMVFIIPQLISLPFDQSNIPITGQLIIVTIGVGYRIMLLFKERLQAEREKKDLLIQQNSILEKQVADRTAELSNSLNNLKFTQAQLIQSEKMASLGELTAGIAHEIQNPLNFVNNFSEVSAELVEEIQEARAQKQAFRKSSVTEATKEEELEDEILEDIKQNLEKINHHGKRADAIVKGMLEHSRSGSGEKELTDINSLASEYLNLVYQSFKSKNKEVDIELITDLDQSLPKIELVRPDIGKVLLNILNNAFYACLERKRQLSQSSNPDGYREESFQPLVTVSTSPLEGGRGVKISVRDNGPGIPDTIKDKIFQPFFTTKPTGQGTGLGLSLSYDIVKAHGGELSIESKSGQGATFIILLPKNGVL
jgi:signal transduction histidine kinase